MFNFSYWLEQIQRMSFRKPAHLREECESVASETLIRLMYLSDIDDRYIRRCIINAFNQVVRKYHSVKNIKAYSLKVGEEDIVLPEIELDLTDFINKHFDEKERVIIRELLNGKNLSEIRKEYKINIDKLINRIRFVFRKEWL